MSIASLAPPAGPPPVAWNRPWLAPLAGFSDLPFRLLCRENGAAAACTEMVSAKGLVYGGQGSADLLATAEADAPLVVQLFGAEEDFVARAMDRLLTAGFRYFDLNAGCSVAKVVKTGAGAALLQTPDRLVALVRTMSRLAGPDRVGVKFRLGFDVASENYLDLGPALAEAGAAWLTLHPRYARQGFGGQADWTAIARLKGRAGVPVLASGDLFTAEDGAACLRQSGADGLMFARGALADPAVFSRLQALVEGRPSPPPPDGRFLARLMRRHVALILQHGSRDGREESSGPERRSGGGLPKAILRMRTVMTRYVKGLEGSRALRKAMTSCTCWEQIEEIIHLAEGLPAAADRRALLAAEADA